MAVVTMLVFAGPYGNYYPIGSNVLATSNNLFAFAIGNSNILLLRFCLLLWVYFYQNAVFRKSFSILYSNIRGPSSQLLLLLNNQQTFCEALG